MNFNINWKLWKNEIKEKFNIEYIDNLQNIVFNDDIILITRCSKIKNKSVIKEIPKNFYLSDLNKKFYIFCETNYLKYGILSDKYGIHFFDEKLNYYDIHPSSLTNDDFIKLGFTIRRKLLERNINKVIFYNDSPILSFPYFKMLFFANLNKVYFITKLKKEIY